MKRSSESAPGDRLVRTLLFAGFIVMIWMALTRINIGPPGSAASADRESNAIREGVARPSLTIDLNHASAAQLQLLPGIGPALSERIVADREQHGPFQSVDDLTRVHGIGVVTVDRVRSMASITPIEPQSQPSERLAHSEQP